MSEPGEERDHARWDAVAEATELLNEERYVEALAQLKAVLEKDAQNAYAYFFTGVALFECGEIAPARDAYRAALLVAPKYLGARIGLSHVYRKLGAYKDAIKEGMTALEQSPGDSDALYAVGMAYHARGDTAAARRYLEAFLDSRPEFEVMTEVRALLAEMGAGAPPRNSDEDDN